MELNALQRLDDVLELILGATRITIDMLPHVGHDEPILRAIKRMNHSTEEYIKTIREEYMEDILCRIKDQEDEIYNLKQIINSELECGDCANGHEGICSLLGSEIGSESQACSKFKKNKGGKTKI